jgi:DNA-binding PadR family transcriptional regulator
MRRGSSDGQGFLGEFEHMVLLAILQAGKEAYAVRILEELDRRAGRRTDRGALYKTLDRLEAKGFLDWTVEPGTPARGGHRRRVFSVRAEGLEALRVSRDALNNLSRGLGSILARGTK